MGGPDPKDHGLTHGWGASEEHAGHGLHGSGHSEHAGCTLEVLGPGHAGRVSHEPSQGAGRTFCLDRHVGWVGLLHKLEKRTGLAFHAGQGHELG